MNLGKETKNHLSQIRNKSKNDHKRKGHFKRMNKESIQYTRESVTNDHVNEINF